MARDQQKKELWYEKNRERLKEYHRKYYQKNKAKFSEQGKKRYAEKKDEIDKKNREYALAHKEEIRAYQEDWRKQNKDKIKTISKRYYKNNTQKVNRRNKKWNDANKEKKLSIDQAYRKNVPKANYSIYKRNARIRGIKFNLTLEQFSLFWQQPCHYCGDEIETIGLDRIDSSGDYCVDNIVPCCSVCNFMKRQLSQDGFIEHCEKIVNKAAKLKQPRILQGRQT